MDKGFEKIEKSASSDNGSEGKFSTIRRWIRDSVSSTKNKEEGPMKTIRERAQRIREIGLRDQHAPTVEAKSDSGNSKITPLRLDTIVTSRQRLKHALSYGRESLQVFAIAGAIGFLGGNFVQGKYRDLLRYSGDPKAPLYIKDEIPDQAPQETVKPPEIAKPLEIKKPQEKQKKSWKEKISETAKKAWGSVKKIAKTGGEAVTAGAKEVIKDTETYKEMAATVEKFRIFGLDMREAGDKISFWGPFSVLFLAAVMAIDRYLKMKKKLNGSMEPEDRARYEEMEIKINKIITTLNDSAVNSPSSLTPTDIIKLRKLVEKFNETTGDIGL